MSKNFFDKEKYISEFICYQLKIVTHQVGYSLACRTVRKIIFCGGYVLPGTPVPPCGIRLDHAWRLSMIHPHAPKNL